MAEEKRGYTISDIYQGGYSTLAPPENTYIIAGSFGMTTDPRTANILQEVSSKLSSGVKQIEVEAVSPDIFDSIPKQHLKEVNRLSKLTGIDVSMHAPVMDVSGIDPRSGFSEAERQTSEGKVVETLKRAHELNPDGNIPVNFHSAEGIPGSQLLPPSMRKKTEKGEETYKQIIAVEKETGRLIPVREEKKFYPTPEGLKEEMHTPEETLKILNKSSWDNETSSIFFNKERADEILEKNRVFIEHFYSKLKENPEMLKDLARFPEQLESFRKVKDVESYLGDIHKQASNLFSKAYKYGTKEQQSALK